MSTAMSTKRVFVASAPRETSSHATWLIASVAGCGLTALGTGIGNEILAGVGAAVLGSGLLYANAILWQRFFGSKR
ncbi:MAG: hypothetical protein LIQ31_14190 [Planctomycetes bacterium]|nr:hypothetical protein [Planctomycetota bacterium]